MMQFRRRPRSPWLAPLLLCFACGPSDMSTASPGVEPSIEGEPAEVESAASHVPVTDIVLFAIEESSAGWRSREFVRVTQRDGYDNQPAFSADAQRLFYTSVRDDAQADIYAYERSTQAHLRMTATAVSEFSPTLHPNARGLSLIRESAPEQWLWHHDLEGKAVGAIVDDISPIGYHAWADAQHVALFIVDTEHGDHPLILVNVDTGTRQQIASGIGRCLQPVPGHRAISYVSTRPEGEGHDILVYDLGRGSAQRIAQLPPGVEDFAWLPDGRLVAAQGDQLLIWSPTRLTGWEPMFSLAEHGISDLSRIAVSRDGRWLAAVERRISEPSE